LKDEHNHFQHELAEVENKLSSGDKNSLAIGNLRKSVKDLEEIMDKFKERTDKMQDGMDRHAEYFAKIEYQVKS